jgi:hypothetical protein
MTLRIVGLICVSSFVLLAVADQDTLHRPLSESVANVFLGTGGSLARYLFGMTLLLFPSISVAIYFSMDWHRRWPLLAIRYGAVDRWLWSSLARQAQILFGYAGGLIAYTLGLRLLLGESANHDWSATLVETMLVLFKLYATCLFFAILTMTVVVFFRIDAAGVIAIPLFIGFGFLPLNHSPWNPVTAWSMRWIGDQEVTACVAISCGVAIALSTLFVVSYYRREWRH